MDSKKYCSKFKQGQIQRMRKLFEDGYGIAYIARKFGCWPNAVWHHVFDLSTPRQVSAKEKTLFTKNSRLSDRDVLKIRELAAMGVGSVSIGRMYRISQTTALGIIMGKTYRWVESKTTRGFIVPLKIKRHKRYTEQKPGIKKGQKREVRNGVLIRLANEYGVKPCTIRRWIVKDKIKLKKADLFNG